MKKNMSKMDGGIRVLVAIIFGVLYFTGTITGTIGIVLVALAAIFVLTSVVSFCPLYTLFGVSTCVVKKE